MKKYICIHGHFYQPPRENAWQERIIKQNSADPYHDWNERITAECYAPNLTVQKGAAHSNVARMSFNFGPTLLEWMRECDPEIYEQIIQADLESQKLYDGCGSAIAQCYNHIIMPLANQEDKHKQVAWAVKDFQLTYDRKPKGMWLPETAVDTATLEILANFHIEYTILAPQQARRILHSDGHWVDIDASSLDTTHPYVYKLPSGKSITVFYYDGALASDVAFGGLLESEDALFDRIKALAAKAPENGLVHWAVDGETYGHHHHKGHLVLNKVIEKINADRELELINYDLYLKLYPAQHEVIIKERTSWSCSHGVGRWHENCGCAIDPAQQGQQQWRKPLREAMNWLRDEVNQYLAKHRADIDETLFIKIDLNKQFIFTSCGWFFDHFKRIETQQIIQYALRVIELIKEVSGDDLSEGFLERLDSIEGARDVCLAIQSRRDICDYGV